jgi:hypothetical protein
MESVEKTQAVNESQAVVFTLPDKRTFEGSVKKLDLNTFELEIDDLPEEPWSVIDYMEAQAKKEDDKYLFLDVRFMGRSMHMGRNGDNSTTLFAPAVILSTNEPENTLSQSVSSLSTSIDNLDLWLNESLFTFHNPMHMQDSMDYMLQKEVGKYKFKGFALTLDLSIGGMRMSRFTREVSLRQHAHINLRSTQKDLPYMKYVEALRSFERLIGLAYRAQITSAEMDVTSQDFSWTAGDSEEPNIFPTYSITLSNVKPAVPALSYPDELTFTHNQIEDFQQLLDRWEELEDNILPMVDVFLTSTSGGSSVLENIFLNRVQAIEGFHRAFRNGDIISVDSYEEQKNRILQTFSGKDKNLLKKVLRHGNQASLAQRLAELDTELKLLGIPTVMICGFDILANTRNYYSHYENDISNVCPVKDFAQLTYQCGQMILALILIELGIDKTIVKQAITKMRY